ncbi:substrate-binding domain-containing protein [Streptomyces glaucosporus]|uniref:Substrate-binding domain-containing protein n=1 Tax=Streptomyces glaucosporus TaxID=284044 RepID=A0ABN3IJ03_9ACTN
MGVFRWEIILAVLGVVVPIAAALYEFVFVGRKRLGYRVQMDTTATDAVHSRYAGALQQLQDGDGTRLADPSFVLLRVENSGATHIDSGDYAALPDDKVGIRVRFPGRRVAGMVVTELSDDFLRPCFADGSGLSVRDGVIELPKVPLNRSAHYKVLAALERTGEEGSGSGPRAEFDPPEVVGGIKGGVGNGGIQETRSQTGTSWRAVALICFLVLVVLGQLAVALGGDDAAALDCAEGKLVLSGSTAFGPVLRDAAEAYRKTCPDAEFAVRTEASSEGLEELDRAGREQGSGSPAQLAFTDGEKGGAYPRLLPRPVAFSLFTLVVNGEAGVHDLSLEQIRRIYDGKVANWKELGGNDLPVLLVGRLNDSGTRRAFEQKVLGAQEPPLTSDDCRTPRPGAASGPIRCERSSTGGVLDAVEQVPGALGYSALGEAADRRDLRPVSIDGHRATLEGADHGAYPFWETEYAHTYGEPPADSLAAGFLRYLTNEVGKDIVRSHGHRPCAELQNPVLCRPTGQAGPRPASPPASPPASGGETDGG